LISGGNGLFSPDSSPLSDYQEAAGYALGSFRCAKDERDFTFDSQSANEAASFASAPFERERTVDYYPIFP
jgi:hypothetical protein